MDRYSTRAAARKLGISFMTLMRYIKAHKITAPESLQVGGGRVRPWTEAQIERARQLLPKIKNGRKTRYLKSKRSEVRSQKSIGPKARPKTKKKH